jgi:tetratricopeptide (TPR) repeat protein
MKTVQVFVSHTSDMAQFPEGRSFVQAVLDAVARAGMVPVDMRYFAARDGKPADYCRTRVQECEIYVAVVGFRYGSIAPGEGVSYTELEFQAATAAGLPRLVFLLEETASLSGNLADADRGPVARFRQMVSDAGLVARAFTSDAGLELEVFHALSQVSASGPATRKEAGRLTADELGLGGSAGASLGAAANGVSPAGVLPTQDSSAVGVAAATRTLPRDITSFTGREPELRKLVGAVTGSADPGGVVGIYAIGGMAGIGKTALAVHAAHELTWRFPDGQIFLPLHGHTPGQRPVDPADALVSLLQTTGVAAQQMPHDLEARTRLWRDRLADKRVLLLLDDAADSEQARPLLPGNAGCLVLVTSRRHLTALEGAQAISLDTLSPDKAAELLVRLATRPDLGAGDAAIGKITRMCGYLPLAVGMLARQLHHHPAWTAAGLADDLAAARDRLELMHAENLSVAAAFNLSYQDLTEAQQRVFRRLGLQPGNDIDAWATAALDGTGLAEARRHLEALYDQYLLTEPARGRYRLHDLIRQHARTLAMRDDLDADRDQATSRLLDYYQQAAQTADRRITRYTRPGPPPSVAVASDRDTTPNTRLGPAGIAASSVAVPDLADSIQALSWARAQRASLLACLDHAARAGQDARVVALTAAAAGLLRHDGPWADTATHHLAAVRAARHLGDRLGEASALIDLGIVRYLTRDYMDAAEVVEGALGIYRDCGDRLGEANALRELGVIRRLTGNYKGAADTTKAALRIYRAIGDRLGQANALANLDYPGTADTIEAALRIYRAIGDRLGQASALSDLGKARWRMGDYLRAASALEEALGIHRDLSDRLGQANDLWCLGAVWQRTGDYAEAAKAAAEAQSISRDIGDLLGQANALSVLGIIRRLTADYPGASSAHETALGIYRDIGDRGGEVETLNEIGTLHRVRGDVGHARAYHRQALDLARKIASPYDEACALAGLGRCAQASGHTDDAQAYLRQAQEIFHRTGTVEP